MRDVTVVVRFRFILSQEKRQSTETSTCAPSASKNGGIMMSESKQVTLADVAETSRIAYREHALSGKLGEQQKEVYKAIVENSGLTRNEISRETGIRLSSVCGRVRELLDLSVIEVTGRRECTITGSINQVLEVVR